MSDLFDRARDAIRLEAYAAKLVTLRRDGDDLRGPCPICAASAKSGTVFKVSLARQTWFCFACNRRGDVVDLHAELTGRTVAEAARDLAGPEPAQAAPRVKAETPIEDDGRADRILRMAADMLSGSRPIAGDGLASRYLVGRGILPAIIERLDGPRFNSDCPHSWNPDAKAWRRAPGIVCRIVTPGGATGGVHVTYLDPHGGKSTLQPAKRMWGPQGEQTALSTRRGGAWLISSFPDDGDLVIGEGMESALALASMLWTRGHRDFGVAAALSLNALQGVLRRDDDGCVDLERPTADPASPAFTWPLCNTAPDARTPTAHLAIDRDMSPIRLKARNGRGKPLDYELDGEARARICERLAIDAWRGAGWKARAYMPAVNRDWADMASAAQSRASMA